MPKRLQDDNWTDGRHGFCDLRQQQEFLLPNPDTIALVKQARDHYLQRFRPVERFRYPNIAKVQLTTWARAAPVLSSILGSARVSVASARTDG